MAQKNSNPHNQYMRRCIELARLGLGFTSPNPMVGSVIVCNNEIIGEGYHRAYGGPHAEVNAIASVQNKELLKEATLYVNLEPCAHYGKTPPCADLITSYAIPKVVIGTVDPFAKVAGKGIEKLKKAGCEVTLNVLKSECLELNKRFFTFHSKKRPYIVLKWAQSSDGFIDGAENKPVWITNESCRVAVHKQRASEDAILIGTNTAIKDNPSLTLREWAGKQPYRFAIDRHHRIPATHHINDGKVPGGILNLSTKNKDNLIEIVTALYNQDIQSVIIEGGAQLLNSFIENNLWDEAHVYIGKLYIEKGMKAPIFNHRTQVREAIGNSELFIYRNG